jgi:diguanylate cyclase (GGDEF)-like protein/PAS domain S-box-containing protein
MSHVTVRVLLVEDDAVDRLACRRALAAQPGYVFEVEEADTARTGLQRAHAAPPDLILLDYHLPDMDGVEFLAELAADGGELPVPVMLLTGAQDISIAVDAMRRGARDYLVKDSAGDYLKLLPTVIQRVLRESQAHADKHAAEEQLRAAEAKYRSLVEQIPAIAFTTALDVPGNLLYVSPQIERLGFSPEEWLANPDGVLNRIHPDDQARVHAAFARSYESGEPLRCEYRLLTRDGAPRWFLDEARVVHDAAGEPLCLQGVLIDITEDKQREAELEFHGSYLELLVAERTGQLEKQTEMLKSANVNLVKEIDERWQAERALRQSEERYRTLFESIDEGFCVIEMVVDTAGTPIDFRFLEVNPAFEGQAGIENAVGRRMREIAPTHEPHWFDIYGRVARTGEPVRFQNRAEALGRYYDVYAFRVDKPEQGRVAALFRDITEHKRAEEALRQSEARFRLLLESAGEGIYGLDSEGRCTFVNEAALAMLGYARDELLGRETHSLIHNTHADGSAYPAETCPVYDAFHTGQACQGLVELHWRKDGSSFPAEYSARPLHEAGQGTEHVSGAVVVFRDVAEAQALRHLLSYQATHDMLTGLINRQEFERRLERILIETRGNGEAYALLYLDLDRFKVVNDTCGHTAGDQLLRQITARLQEHLRGRDTLARLGGDEFGVLLEHCPLDQALRIATDLRDAAQDYRFVWEGKPFSVSASIGLVPLSATTGSVSDALAAADSACYAAKEQGRNRVHLYQPDDVRLVQQHTQMQWVSRLTHALDTNRFRLYQQVIAPLGQHGQSRPHHEVLLRLLDEEGRVVEPMAFVPAAERYNLMPAIDRWVVREVISRHAVQQRHAPVAERPIFAVNLSGSSLADERLAEFVCGLLAEHGVPADMLCFEISETVAIANLSRAAQFIQTLKREGCLFALDNFGSGMSSFACLKQLPVDFLKIDGSFIRTMVEDRLTRAMAEAINRVAHVMAIETVAECVESAPTLALLQELGVDHAQGYALARPQPLPEADAPVPGAEGTACDTARRP